jgi:hypothetical protein
MFTDGMALSGSGALDVSQTHLAEDPLAVCLPSAQERTDMRREHKDMGMRFKCIILTLAMSSAGCTTIAALLGRQPIVDWPTADELATLQPVSNDVNDEFNGQAALVAARAIQEVIQLWSDQGLFEGCPAPALGLGAVVYPWKGVYYVNVTQRFDRCGGKRYRMLDWWESFAVSPEGRVLARRPHGF